MTNATCCKDIYDAPHGEGETMGKALNTRLVSLFEWLKQALIVARQRRALAELDDHQLADIGISREDAEREANRAFWDF